MSLATINAHPRDAHISFIDETHVYYIHGSSDGYLSTTTLVHKMFPHFDADLIIKKMMNAKKWPNSPYFGMTAEAIKKQWNDNGKQAADLGTKMHANLEDFFNGLPHETDTKEFEMFQQWHSEHKYEPYRTEWIVYDEDSKICGSVDLLVKDPNEEGAILIYDYKRSKEIKFDNYFQKGIHPLTSHLPDCNFYHYSLQLYIYRHMLETLYGQKVNGCFLLVLHPNQEKYLKIECEDMSAIVKELFQLRANGDFDVSFDDNTFDFIVDKITG
jgi:ATP-dependent exoDNAse (exonuclease V) beta subunit